jgi:hypothetical protein
MFGGSSCYLLDYRYILRSWKGGLSEFYQARALYDCQLCLTDSKNYPGVGHFPGAPDAHNFFNAKNLLLFPTEVVNVTSLPDSDHVFNYIHYA